MTKRLKARSVKARNPIAKKIREPLFHLRLKPSKKLYQRKLKHRGRATDLGSERRLRVIADLGSHGRLRDWASTVVQSPI